MSNENSNELQVTILPESLAEIVEGLKLKGFSDDEISEEISKIHAMIVKQVEDQIENGDIDLIEDYSEETSYLKRLH